MERYQIKHTAFIIILSVMVMILPMTSDAGLLSGLAKLGKKIDAPDTHISSAFHFTDELAKYPAGSVAEVHFSVSQNKWLAKTPDGKTVAVDDFTSEATNANHRPTLLVSDKNLPSSLASFNHLPANVDIKIKLSKGKSFSFKPDRQGGSLIDRNISVAVGDIRSLKSAIWQLNRPLSTPKMRLIKLADNAERVLAKQNYGSKITVDSVGTNQLSQAIASMRMQTAVISAKLEDGFIIHGKQKIAVADLEKVAAEHDVNLVILDSDKPDKTLQSLAKDWQQKKQAGELSSYTTSDFYNAFVSPNAAEPSTIKLSDSGQLRTALQFEHRLSQTEKGAEAGSFELVRLPLDLLVKSAQLYRPNEARTKELDRRIHPAIPSDVHFALLVSFVIGFFTLHTSWFLYKKLWASPLRVRYSNRFIFSVVYLLHRLSFLVLYLPLFGLISPIYLIIKWAYMLIEFVLIRPISWLVSKVN
jgi:hypothetical protein